MQSENIISTWIMLQRLKLFDGNGGAMGDFTFDVNFTFGDLITAAVFLTLFSYGTL